MSIERELSAKVLLRNWARARTPILMCKTATSRLHGITARWQRQRNEAQSKKAPSDVHMLLTRDEVRRIADKRTGPRK
jgi:hypothetical protein